MASPPARPWTIRSNLATSWPTSRRREAKARQLGRDPGFRSPRNAPAPAAGERCRAPAAAPRPAVRRDLLVLHRLEQAVAEALHQLQETGIVVERGAQHQGVDEEADQALERSVVAAGDHRADRHLAACRRNGRGWRRRRRRAPRRGGVLAAPRGSGAGRPTAPAPSGSSSKPPFSVKNGRPGEVAGQVERLQALSGGAASSPSGSRAVRPGGSRHARPRSRCSGSAGAAGPDRGRPW